jgi:hypothetical protein
MIAILSVAKNLHKADVLPYKILHYVQDDNER